MNKLGLYVSVRQGGYDYNRDRYRYNSCRPTLKHTLKRAGPGGGNTLAGGPGPHGPTRRHEAASSNLSVLALMHILQLSFI